jgi:hypothetical protein
MDLRWLQINQATVSVDFKAHNLERLFFNSTFPIVISGCSKTDNASVFFVDLVPEGLKVLEHDLVTFVNDQYAFSRFSNVANTDNVMQSLLCVRLSLEKYREQICLFSFITIPQTFVRIYHVHMYV